MKNNNNNQVKESEEERRLREEARSFPHGNASDWLAYTRSYLKQSGKTSSIYISTHFQNALENGWISVSCQPVIRTMTGQICAFECLARWNDPTYGILAPGEFLETLEKSRQLYHLDLFVLEEACRFIQERQNNREAPVPFTVNLSVSDHLYCDLFEEVQQLTRKYDVSRDMINLNILANLTVRDERVETLMKKFMDAGYPVWLSHTGNPYSAISVLAAMPMTGLVIDARSMKNTVTLSRSMISSIVHLAKENGCHTLVIGVEDKDQADFLWGIGCEREQGNYFCKSTPYRECAKICEDKGMAIESRSHAALYDQAGQIDLVTGSATAILQYDGEKTVILGCNDVCRQLMKNQGYEHTLELEKKLNAPGSGVGTFLKSSAQKMILTGKRETVSIQTPKGRVIGDFTITAKAGPLNIFRVGIRVDSRDPVDNDISRDYILKNAFTLFDRFFIFNLTKGTAEDIMIDRKTEGQNVSHYSAEELIRVCSEEYIFPEDRARFLEFLDMHTILARIKDSGDNKLYSFFRTLQNDGTAHWKVHAVLHVERGRDDCLLYCVYPLGADSESAEQRKILEKNLLKESASGEKMPAKKTSAASDILHGARSIADNLALYVDDFRKKSSDFAVLLLSVPLLRMQIRHSSLEGRDTVLTPIRNAISDVLRRTVPGDQDPDCTFGCFSNGKIALFTRSLTHQNSSQFCSDLTESIRAIPEIAADPSSNNIFIDITFASDLAMDHTDLSESMLEYLFRDPSLTMGREKFLPVSDESLKELQFILNQVPYGAFVVGPSKKIVLWNQGAERLTGYSGRYMIGRSCRDFGEKILDSNGNKFCDSDCPFDPVTPGSNKETSCFVSHRDGYRVLLEFNSVLLSDYDGNAVSALILFNRRSSRTFTEETILRLYDSSARDPITGLAKRSYMESLLRYRISDYHRTGNRFLVLFTNINSLSRFTETYGSEAEKHILKAFGRTYQRGIRRSDFCGC